MKHGNLYSASDKALYDALNQHTVNSADLRYLFLTHGIIISRHTPRQELASHFSRLVHDYGDFQALAKLFDTGQRKERLASFRIRSSANIEQFESAAHAVVAKLQSATDAATLRIAEDGSLEILVRYKKFHFNKSEFRQLETKDALISIEQEGDVVVVRGPQNEKMDEICRELISTVETFVEDPIDIDEIELAKYPAPTTRTRFFVDLINAVNGYKKHDVTDVFVFKPKILSEVDASSDDEDQAEEDSELGIHISRASLKGEGVLESEEMQSLIARGFYISKIVWQAKESGIDPDIFEFEAQFTEPETCTRFSYLVRGHYKYQGNQQHSKTRTHLSSEDDRELSKAIESAARKSLKDLQVGGASD